MTEAAFNGFVAGVIVCACVTLLAIGCVYLFSPGRQR